MTTFDELADGIVDTAGNFLRVQPDGRTRTSGFQSNRYQQMVEMLPLVARADLAEQGFPPETIAEIVFPNKERQRSTFTRKIENAITTAAERGRFR